MILTRSKTVRGPDGRVWAVRRMMLSSLPATESTYFEHDVDGGRRASVTILIILLLFYIVLFGWMPADVHVPWWVVLIGMVVAGFFPVSWVLRRPWQLVAQTPGGRTPSGVALEPEHWVGTVRGVTRSREEVKMVVKSIRTKSTPAYVDSPLQPLS
jgi:hypothetical protein